MTLVKRRLLSLAVLAAVVALAWGLMVWQEGRGERARAEKEKHTAVFALAGPEGVKELLVKNNGTVVELVRNVAPAPQGWSITKPIATAADAVTVDALVRDLTELKRGRDLTQTANKKDEDLVLFGLDKPRIEVTLTLSDGTSQSLTIGKKNSYDDTLYVKRAKEDHILVVPGGIFFQLDADLYKLREKKIVGFETSAISKLSLTRASVPAYTLEKNGNDYQFSAPQKALADETKIREILSSLTALRADKFVSETASAAELGKYGLAPPCVVVSLEAGSATNAVTVLLGTVKQGTTTHYYATRQSSSPIMEVSAENLLTLLRDDFAALRDKRVLHFDRDAVASIVLQGETGAAIKAKRVDSTKDKPERWELMEPVHAPADELQISSLLFKLWDLKATRIVVEQAKEADYKAHGLNKPQRSVSLLNKDGVELAALLIAGPQGDNQLVCARGTGPIGEADKSKVGEVSFALADYQQDKPAESKK